MSAKLQEAFIFYHATSSTSCTRIYTHTHTNTKYTQTPWCPCINPAKRSQPTVLSLPLISAEENNGFSCHGSFEDYETARLFFLRSNFICFSLRVCVCVFVCVCTSVWVNQSLPTLQIGGFCDKYYPAAMPWYLSLRLKFYG